MQHVLRWKETGRGVRPVVELKTGFLIVNTARAIFNSVDINISKIFLKLWLTIQLRCS